MADARVTAARTTAPKATPRRSCQGRQCQTWQRERSCNPVPAVSWRGASRGRVMLASASWRRSRSMPAVSQRGAFSTSGILACASFLRSSEARGQGPHRSNARRANRAHGSANPQEMATARVGEAQLKTLHCEELLWHATHECGTVEATKDGMDDASWRALTRHVGMWA